MERTYLARKCSSKRDRLNLCTTLTWENRKLLRIREVDDQLITVSDGDEDPDEDVTILKSIIKCHRIFNKRCEGIIQRLFGMDYDFYKRMVHDQTVEKSIAGSHFQRSDIMRMLSEQFVRDNSLDMYMEVLKQKFIDERKSGRKKNVFCSSSLLQSVHKGKYKSTAFRVAS